MAANLVKSLRDAAIKTARKLGAPAVVGQRLPGRWDGVATRREPQQGVFANRGAGAARRRGAKAGTQAAAMPAAAPAFRRETPGRQMCEEMWGPQSSKEEAKAFFREATARERRKQQEQAGKVHR
jgi:hypothetical protein